jgi:hypothetical protein
MANYYGSARSNYFKVKDLEAFKRALSDVAVGIWDGDVGTPTEGLIAVFSQDADGAGWPSFRYDEASDDYVDIDLVNLIAPHLEDGWVCILQEAGAEKLRYLIGHAVAFNNAGEVRTVNIDDIYSLAKQIGEHVTQASY